MNLVRGDAVSAEGTGERKRLAGLSRLLTSPGVSGYILQGDCLQGLGLLPDGLADLIFADPPYNLSGKGMSWIGKSDGGDWYKVNEAWDRFGAEDYEQFTNRWVAQAKRVLRPGGVLWICCSMHNLGECQLAAKHLGMTQLNVVTWVKVNPIPNMTRRQFTYSCEYLLVFANGPRWRFNYEDLKALNPERARDGGPRAMRDAWALPVCQGRERLHGPDGKAAHPTQKPEELVRRALVANTAPGDLVVDPFLGSGTTAAVAQAMGRRWLGIESKAEYAELARGRLAIPPERVLPLSEETAA